MIDACEAKTRKVCFGFLLKTKTACQSEILESSLTRINDEKCVVNYIILRIMCI